MFEGWRMPSVSRAGDDFGLELYLVTQSSGFVCPFVLVPWGEGRRLMLSSRVHQEGPPSLPLLWRSTHALRTMSRAVVNCEPFARMLPDGRPPRRPAASPANKDAHPSRPCFTNPETLMPPPICIPLPLPLVFAGRDLLQTARGPSPPLSGPFCCGGNNSRF